MSHGKNAGPIDEELFREVVSRSSRGGSILDTIGQDSDGGSKVLSVTASIPEPPQNTSSAVATGTRIESDQPEPRRRRVLLPDYEATFLKRVEIPDREVVYVSREAKRRLNEIVRLLGDGNLSVSSYVDHILRHHFELYKDQINLRHKEKNRGDIL